MKFRQTKDSQASTSVRPNLVADCQSNCAQLAWKLSRSHITRVREYRASLSVHESLVLLTCRNIMVHLQDVLQESGDWSQSTHANNLNR